MRSAQPQLRASAAQRTSNSGLLATGVVLAIGVLSFLPLGDKKLLHTKGRFHSLGHLLAFTIAAFVLLRAGKSRHAQWILFFGTLLFGLCIEFGQHLVYRMPVESSDMVIDTIGVALGAVFALWSQESQRA